MYSVTASWGSRGFTHMFGKLFDLCVNESCWEDFMFYLKVTVERHSGRVGRERSV